MNFDDSKYSHNYRMLWYLGAWMYYEKDPFKSVFYAAYQTTITFFAVVGILGFVGDLYMVFGDFKKVTWNLCVSTLFTAGLMKNLYAYHKHPRVNGMRTRLYRDGLTWDTPEDQVIHMKSLKEYKTLRMVFYGAYLFFTPFWLALRYFSYLWGPREIPIPLRFPFNIDYDDEIQYNVAFLLFAYAGLYGLFFIAHTELGMFSLLIQISRENKKLLKDIPKVNSLYEDDDPQMEVNPFLRRIKTKFMLREYSMRQQKIVGYLEGFELVYSYSLLIQMFALSVLIIVSAIQCLLEAGNISLNLSYQIGYTVMLVVDMFLICWYSTQIREQCTKIGEVTYSTYWYRMPLDLRKDIHLMIIRSQKPPKLTAGKLMDLDLHTFMLLLRNIYSWVTLFDQLALK